MGNEASTPLIASTSFVNTKDPCIVFDGQRYHIYGSGSKSYGQVWDVAHFTAPGIDGPWTEEAPAVIEGVCGPRVCAPGVVFDDGVFHMFIQTECFGLAGTVEYATSTDGVRFTRQCTALASLDGDEAGIYDPHPAIILRDGRTERYITYTGMPRVSRGDIYLAKSETGSWAGPWVRLGRILSHEQVAHHNQHDDPAYEWGLEGSQLVQMPDGRFLLNAVCFLPGLPRYTRQRVFFGVSDDVTGPFCSLGPVIETSCDGWDSGENGHASALLHDGRIYLFYQARPIDGPWCYGRAIFDLSLKRTG